MYPNTPYNQYNQYNQFNQYNNQYNNQFNQYNQYNPQYLQELKVIKDIEIKFFRLSPPLHNTKNIPLSGIYNDLENIEEDQENPLKNKFSKFDISSPSNVGIENILYLNPSFGRVFAKETLEGLITFTNVSEHEVYIKDLQITLKIDEKPETNTKEQKQLLDIKLPSEGVLIHKKTVYSVKFSRKLNDVSKYTIEINLKARSSYYDYQYNSQKYMIKDKGKDYQVVDGCLEIFHSKKLTFDVNYPFKIYEKFHNYQMNICYIETKIANNTIYPLTLTDLYISPKSKPNIKLPVIDDLEQLNKNQNQKITKLLSGQDDNKSFLSKFLTLQQDDEANVIFKVEDPKIFYGEKIFILHIKWLNLFDCNEKNFSYEFNNRLNTFNNLYNITVVEKPEKDIVINQNFKITLKLEGKNLKKKCFVSLMQESLRDNDKFNEREIEIIDIIEKKIELSQKSPSNNFILICKSDFLGNVYLPRLKFVSLEDNSNKPNINIYDALLNFNCIEKEGE
jgi:hypothetical protein